MTQDENAEPDSRANGGGRTPFAVSNVVDRRHRSLWSFAVTTEGPVLPYTPIGYQTPFW